MNKQQGFTLIELIVVIILLGILAAIAVPKFINVSVDAQTNADAYSAGAAAEHAKNSAACTASGFSAAKCNP